MELNLLSGLLLLALLCLALLPFAIPGVLEVLLALAIGAFVSAALIWFGWLPQDTSLVLLSLAMLTALSAVLLWKPLRKLQKIFSLGSFFSISPLYQQKASVIKLLR